MVRPLSAASLLPSILPSFSFDFLLLLKSEFRGEMMVRMAPNIFQLLITITLKRGDDLK